MGKRLSNGFIDIAKIKKQKQINIHSIKTMQTAWVIYECLDLKQSERFDFAKDYLSVYRFRLVF